MKRLFFTTIMLLWVAFTFGQLTGTKLIPGDYATLAAAITDLNTQGVGPGGVTIELTAGNPETAPAGGYEITASGNPNSPILIKGNANTITSSNSLTGGALNDAFFKIIGGDYITIDGFVMQENAANTTTTAASNNMTEFGVALFYTSSTDGPQHCTIQNNTITLGAAYQNAMGVYANSRHNATSMTTTNDITSPDGAFSFLRVLNNTISSVNLGVVLVGSTTAAYMATNVEVTGNNITFGRTDNFSSYISVSGSVNGIYINNTLNVTVNNNTITSNGTCTSGTLRGIYHNATGTLPTTGNYVNNYNYNVITLTNGTTSAIYGIHLDNLNAQFTTNVNGNTISNLNASVATTANVFGIYHQGTSLNQYINGNLFYLIPNTTTGTVYVIHGGNTVPPNGSQSVQNNYIQLNKSGAGGTVYGYYSASSSTSSVVKNISNNTIENITLTGATTFYGIYDNYGGAPVKTISNNTIQNVTGGTSAITAVYLNYGVHHVFGNTIKNITNGANITGITAGGSSTSLANVFNNQIYTLSATAGNVNGVVASASGTGAISNVYSNRIYNLTAGAATSTVAGISISAGTTVTAYNNFVSELNTPAATNTTTPVIAGIAALGGTNVNLYYNTVYLNATSTGTDFSTCALYASTIPANLKLNNNILVNTSTPNGAGLTVAFRRAEVALSKYDGQSSNNCFYAGTPSATNLVYYDGTNSYQTLADMQTAVAPRENGSLSEMPPFVNVSVNPYDLHMQTTVATGLESGGIAITGIENDIDNNVRYGSAGYTGTGSATDIGADEFEGMPNFTCTTPVPGNTIASNTSVCLNETINLSLQNVVPGTGITYQWKKSTDGTTYTDMPSATSSTVSGYAITEPTYFECEVTCANGPVSVISTPVFVDLANKILTTTPGSVCGAGQATLQATATGGSTINWYDAPTGGNLVGMGSPFTTPLISATTNYYVAAENVVPINATIGMGSLTSSSYESPFYHLFGGLKSQYLIRASELQAAGLTAGPISALSYEVVTAGTTYQELNVSVGTTASSVLNTTFLSGLTNIYYNAAYTPTIGLNTITFTTPFIWDGTSNLVIEFCWSNNNGGGTSTTVKYDNTTYAAQSYYRADNQLPSVLCGTTTATATQTKRPMFTLNGTNICSSPRVEVTATVGASTPITISNDVTICNDAITSIQVTSGASSYDEFTWTPETNLFTDAACTTPYVAGASASQVYMKTNVAGIYNYVCAAYNTSTLCGATDTIHITVLPASVTFTASPSSICVSGATTLNVTPITGFGTAMFQFAESSDGTTFSDISGANGFNYTTGVLNSTMYYQWTATAGTETCIQQQVQVAVTNPTITSTTPASACGQGTVTLGATANSGSTILWYDSLTAIYPLATGNSFTTPVLTATEDYFVEPVIANNTFNVGPVSDIPSALASWGNYGMYFATTSAAVINSVDIYPSTAGTLNVMLVNDLSQVVDARTFTIASGDISTTIKKTLNLDFYVPANTTGWSLYYDLAINRGSGTYAYPYTSNGFSITGNTVNGNNITGGTRMYFYNWQVTSLCSGTRDQVVATVTVAPAVVVNSSANDICAGSSVTLTASSSNADYTYAWSTNDNGQTITVNPTSPTTFVVTASDANTGCITTAETDVNVYPLPVATATVDNATITCGQSVQLTAGELYSPEILLENFNGATHSMTAVNTSTGGTVAAAAWTLQPDGYVYGGNTYHSPDNSQFIMSNSDAQGSGGTTHTELISMPFSSVGVDSITIMMDHYFRSYSGSSVKVDIYDGTQWTTLQTWTTTQGNFDAFAHVTIPLSSSYLNNPALQIRFVFDATWGYYWAIDNAGVNLYRANTFTWSSVPLGFNSTLYNPTDAPVVTTQYNVVVTSSYNCTNSASVTVTVNNPAAPTVTVNNLCGQSELTASNYTGTLVWSTGANTETITVTNNNPVTVTYTDGACTSDAAVVTPAPIEIPATPTVNPVNACFGETVDAFMATSNYTDFVWYADAALTIPLGNGATFQSQETNVGTYTYYVVAMNGTCASDAAVATLTINALPSVTITQNVDTLYSSVNNGNQWYNSQGAIAGATDSTYTVTEEDDYYVVVTDANGCSAMSNSIHVIPTAIAQNQFASMISVSPNPAHGYTVVNLGSVNNAKIEIVSADGKVVYNTTIKTNIETISLNGFATGLYTVKVTTDGKTIQKKLVVE
jgi:hypothetical protein